ncbi:cytochrome P450 family protein [Streptomyces europaeiscabiei]|uniref:cytochrome P450 family protein n=1 Tax=Streptomyces europaeiscabiei TaxID=146819 RepID=UPI0029B02613|nr:cytochrome P450 [Streptomyces europaeiscabiei]MDX3584203.1 cytochrome P450 [Streptomyces europaeiscabiei]
MPDSTLQDAAALSADPYATLARMRNETPVCPVIGTDSLRFWLVTHYDDVKAAFVDPRLSLDRSNALPGQYQGMSLPPALDANLLNMDPPDHSRIRSLVGAAFTGRRVEQLRAPIQRIADELIDAVAPLGHADLVAAYTALLPIAVICDLLGVPPAARPDFRAWTDSLTAPDPARPERARDSVAHLWQFFTRLIADKRREPGDDLLTDLIAACDRDDQLTEDELTSLAFLILFAGYENTVHLIGNAVMALLDHPEQAALLREDPGLIEQAVDELMRFDGPAPLAIRRFPTEDVEIGGVRIPAGETVLLSLASANRDSARYDKPDRLDVRRTEGGHLALGHGIHYCLGAPLARLETAIAIGTLLRRLPGLALAEPRDQARWRPSIRSRGLLSLDVVFDTGPGEGSVASAETSFTEGADCVDC